MNRRAFVRAAGGGTAVALAGCTARENGDEVPEEPEDEGELRVATHPPMVRGDEPASEWIREAFEEEYPDAEIDWIVPEAGVELYVRQRRADAELGADLFLGLTVPDLVEVDAALEDETRLFEPLDRDRLTRADRLRDGIAFGDPNDRALPFATDFLAIVYDERAVEPPTSFADLLEPEHRGRLLLPDARTSRTGLSALLWTIRELGEADAFEFWADLAATDVSLLEDWANAYYDVYAEGDGSSIVGYSTAGVVASNNDWDPERHRVVFPNGRSYEVREGVGLFADSPRTELAYEFVDFVLSNEAQEAIASLGGRYPAVDESYVELTEHFVQHAPRPVESNSYAYGELTGRVDGWIDEWADAVDS